MSETNSKYIKYEYYNSRSLIAIPTRSDFEISSIDNKILEVQIGNEPIVELDDTISCINEDITHKYVCNKIIELDDRSFLIQESVGNLCNSFITPLIIETNIIRRPQMYNCYVSKEWDKFYAVFKFSSDESYMKLEEELMRSINFISKTDYKSGFVVFEFKIKDLKITLGKFFNGSYSKLSPAIKGVIMDYCKNIHIKDVLTKSQERRKELEDRLGLSLSKDQELASKPTECEYYEYFVDKVLNKHEKN